MSRNKRKSKDDAQEQPDNADSAQQPHDNATMPNNDPGQEGQAGAESQTGWVSKLPEPFGRHTIDLGGGRRLRLLRSNRWQQSQIAFLAPEGEDPKPDAKYTRWLREHGWQWRGQDKAWTKQFDKNTEQERYARSNSDLADQQAFVELANLIRQDKGMEPVLPMTEQRSVGA
jgi:hypothetical protein